LNPALVPFLSRKEEEEMSNEMPPGRKGIITITPEIAQMGNISWAQVELFRWQYGELPKPEDTREIDYEKAFKAASEGCKEGKLDPFNASMMLWYAGELLKGKKIG
jgi:hypothetical protein